MIIFRKNGKMAFYQLKRFKYLKHWHRKKRVQKAMNLLCPVWTYVADQDGHLGVFIQNTETVPYQRNWKMYENTQMYNLYCFWNKKDTENRYRKKYKRKYLINIFKNMLLIVSLDVQLQSWYLTVPLRLVREVKIY